MAETIVAGSLPTTETTVDGPNGTRTRIVDGGSFRAVYGKPDDAPSKTWRAALGKGEDISPAAKPELPSQGHNINGDPFRLRPNDTQQSDGRVCRLR